MFQKCVRVFFFLPTRVYVHACTCVCVASVSHVQVSGHCALQRQLIRNSRRALLTIPSEYAKRDRREKGMEMKIMTTENKGMAERKKWQGYAEISAR